MTDVELAIRLTADANDASAAFDDVGSSAVAMADDVARSAADADEATRGLAEGADAMASSATKAAGGLGDLGGALEMVPGPVGEIGAGMTSLQPIIMGVAGAGDLLNLALESNVVISARAKAAAIAQAAASKTVSVATKVWAAGQWLLNAALTANPIGIVVVAVAALVAGIILAYKKSETFRAVVDTAMTGAKVAIGWVVDKAKALYDLAKDKLTPIWETVSGAISAAKDLIVPYFEAITAPVRTLVGLVKDLVDWIGKIDFPDIPDIPGLRVAARGGTGSAAELAAGGGTVVLIGEVSTLDPRSFVRELRTVLRRENIALGGVI